LYVKWSLFKKLKIKKTLDLINECVGGWKVLFFLLVCVISLPQRRAQQIVALTQHKT